MGLQTQLGEVKFEQLYRLELPVVVNQGASYVLLLEVKESHHVADPEKGRIDYHSIMQRNCGEKKYKYWVSDFRHTQADIWLGLVHASS